MSKRLTGLNPLAYMGVEPEMPPNMYMSPNAPTPTDVFNFNLGDFWVDTTTQQLWVLVSQQKGVAKWITLFGGAADSFVTDSGTAVPAAGILNVNGDGLNILTSGTGNTVTIRMNPDPTFGNVTIEDSLTLSYLTGGVLVSNGSGDISEVVTTNHSLLVGNASGTISSLGVATNGQIPIGSTGADPVLSTITAGTGITVTNGAGTITIASTGAGLTFDGNTGSATESGGIINIVGTGGLSTTASGNTVTINGGNVPQTVTFSLTSTQIKHLVGTPIQVIAAQGAGKIVNVLGCNTHFNYGGSNVFVASTSAQAGISLYLTDNSTENNNQVLVASVTQYTASTSSYSFKNFNNGVNVAVSNTVNAPLVVAVGAGGAEISGNAANDNTITFVVTYEVIPTF